MSKIRSIVESTLLENYADAKSGYFIRRSEGENQISYYIRANNINNLNPVQLQDDYWTNSIFDCTLFEDQREARRALAEYLNALRWEEFGGPGSWLGDVEEVYEELIKKNDVISNGFNGNYEFSIGHIYVN